jgi:hypothetical protein
MSTERADRILARIDAPAQGQQMILELQRRSPGAVEALRGDPISWLQAWDELEIRLLAPQPSIPDDSPRCQVEGGYRFASPLPRIGIGHSSPARMNFTALHELGHHLQRTTASLLENLGNRDDVGEALEEVACDYFAAEILIPRENVAAILGTQTPAATDVARLWQTLPHVSRQAVVVRAAQNLQADGHILLVDDDARIEICGSRGAFRVPRGCDQSATAIWSALRRSRTDTATARTQFAYTNGLQAGETMYAQAAPMGQGHTVIVASVERVPWQLSVYQAEIVQYGTWWTCERTACGESFRATTRCTTCGTPKCPSCNHCECRVVQEFTCVKCFLVKTIAEQSTKIGVCTECEA